MKTIVCFRGTLLRKKNVVFYQYFALVHRTVNCRIFSDKFCTVLTNIPLPHSHNTKTYVKTVLLNTVFNLYLCRSRLNRCLSTSYFAHLKYKLVTTSPPMDNSVFQFSASDFHLVKPGLRKFCWFEWGRSPKAIKSSVNCRTFISQKKHAVISYT